jgi:hypothetical protein
MVTGGEGEEDASFMKRKTRSSCKYYMEDDIHKNLNYIRTVVEELKQLSVSFKSTHVEKI